MTRTVFLLASGVVALFFGFSMIVAPDQMLQNVTTSTDSSAANVVQWMGCALIAVGCLNVLARRDPGGPALKAVLVANIVMHALGWVLDIYQHRSGFVKTQGLIMGSVVHLVLLAGFAFYLKNMTRAAQA